MGWGGCGEGPMHPTCAQGAVVDIYIYAANQAPGPTRSSNLHRRKHSPGTPEGPFRTPEPAPRPPKNVLQKSNFLKIGFRRKRGHIIYYYPPLDASRKTDAASSEETLVRSILGPFLAEIQIFGNGFGQITISENVVQRQHFLKL